MKAAAAEGEEEEGEKRRGLGACVSDKSPPPVSLLPSVPAYYTAKNFEELTQCFEIRRLATRNVSL